MATKKKLLEAAAGSAGGAGLDVNEVFSTYLYDGNGSTQTITNGIDLAGEGGLVWIKSRNLSSTGPHRLFDTVRGVNTHLDTASTAVQSVVSNYNQTFDSNGFSFNNSYTSINASGNKYASWTFRKAPKFFDVVTYTGDGTAGRTVSHNLGVEPGFIVVKRTNSTGSWAGYHRSIGNTAAIQLNYGNAKDTYVGYWNNTSPTSTEFTLGSFAEVNGSGDTFVAYLFAHNDGDGEFGSEADQDIIKCGSYSGDGTSNGTNVVTLGWEPQWLLIKNTTSADSWVVMDNMRGLVNGGGAVGADGVLFPDTSGSEAGWDLAHPTATGFTFTSAGGNVNQSGQTYIYIAIRRGPMGIPESASEVFAIDASASSTEPSWSSNFPLDFNFYRDPSGGDNWYTSSRLTGNKFMYTNSTGAELSDAIFTWDYMDGWGSRGSSTSEQSWMWKRAPSFFDVVAYTGNGTAGRTVSHNLGAAPEMIITKRRSDLSNWMVYHSSLGNTKAAYLDSTTTPSTSVNWWNNTSPTSNDFTLGTDSWINASGSTYIAYLFASLDGVSKVFSATKSSGSDASVNCGFSAGPRFVLLKRTDSTGDWYVWDSERGIVSGNDPYLLLNSTAAEVTSTDYIDPTSNGFTIVNGGLADGDYVGYAVS